MWIKISEESPVTQRIPSIRVAALAAAAALAFAACSGGASPAPSATPTPTAAPTEAPTEAPTQAPTQAPTEAPTEAPPSGPAVAVASSSLGDIVVDANGMTLYLFEADTQGDGKSVCNGACAATWPALLVGGGATPVAGAGVTGTLGTATRDDGTTQVTLNGWPLYYFAGDAAAGDTNGQGLSDVWWVVNGAGDAIKG